MVLGKIELGEASWTLMVFPAISEAASTGGEALRTQTYVRRLRQCDVNTRAEILSAQCQGHRRRSVQRQPISEQRDWCVNKRPI